MLRKFVALAISMFVLIGCTVQKEVEKKDDGSKGSNDPVQLELSLNISQEEKQVMFDLSLKNEGEKPVELLFTSGQQFEISVVNESGERVYRYSDDKMFTQALQKMTIEAGKTVKWHDQWAYSNDLLAGKYKVIAQVTASKINDSTDLLNQLVEEGDFNIKKTLSNNAFNNISVIGTSPIFTVTGEARVFEGVFQYEVNENGTTVQSGVANVPEGAPMWSLFSLSFDLSNIVSSSSVIVVELFVYSAKDGSKVDIITIPIN
jgi:hypothetical protein